MHDIRFSADYCTQRRNNHGKTGETIPATGVLWGARCGIRTTTYTRMTKFTSLSKSKNPKTYSRQYVDEDAAIEDVVGYAESISYAFDEEVGNAVHADIANIADEEQLGEDAVREIIVVFLDQEGETSGSKRAVKRSYAVIPNGEGDKVEAYTRAGDFKCRGPQVFGESHPPMIGKPSHSLRTRNVPAVF